MRLLLSSILASLILTAGCDKSGDNTATSEAMKDKAKPTIDATTDKDGGMTQERIEALKELDAMHEAATGGKVQDTEGGATKETNNLKI